MLWRCVSGVSVGVGFTGENRVRTVVRDVKQSRIELLGIRIINSFLRLIDVYGQAVGRNT